MVEATQPQGLKVHVVCDPGGGAPALDVAQVQSVFSSPPAASQQAVSSSHTMATHAAVEAGVSGDGAPSGTGAAGAPSAPGAHGPQGMTAAQDRQEAPAHDCVGSGMDAAGIGQREACEQAGSNGFHGEAGQAVSADDPPPHTGLLLLLPLTLGVGKVGAWFVHGSTAASHAKQNIISRSKVKEASTSHGALNDVMHDRMADTPMGAWVCPFTACNDGIHMMAHVLPQYCAHTPTGQPPVLPTAAGGAAVSTDSRYRGRPPLILPLLCWPSRRQPHLPGPT